MAQPALPKDIQALGVVLQALEELDDRQRQFVLRTAADRLGTSFGQGGGPGQPGPPPVPGRPPAVPMTSGGTPKEFLRQKQPKTEMQQIACLAHYLTHARDQHRFKTVALTKLNGEAGGTTISNSTRAVREAQSHDLLSASGKHGMQITTRGEDVVNALPDQEAVKALLSSGRRRRDAGRKGKRPRA